MNTYKSRRPSVNYRKIWETHNGPIPIDEHGRSYEIHHIDGNPFNNNITNLQALSIKEHYNVHYSQGDWYACYMIAKKMNKSPEELSEISKKANRERIKNGTHNFLGGDLQREHWRKREYKAYPKSEEQEAVRIKKIIESNLERSLKGIHPFKGPKLNKQMIAEGRHTSSIKLTCPHCSKVCSINTAKQWHFDNCKAFKDH